VVVQRRHLEGESSEQGDHQVVDVEQGFLVKEHIMHDMMKDKKMKII